jgi:DNA-binding NarL/FixJ family response regulator
MSACQPWTASRHSPDRRPKRARASSARVLTTFAFDEYVYEALRAGASGFLLKDAPEEQLVSGIRIVADGGSPLLRR